MDEDDVREAVLSFPAGSVGGPDGLRPQHLRDMVRCHEHAEIRPRSDTNHARRASLAQCAAASQVQAQHHDAPLSTQLCSPVPL